jgi:hypothetical protein
MFRRCSETPSYDQNGAPSQDQQRKKPDQQSNYDPYSPVHLLGSGKLTERQQRKLTEDEKRELNKLVGQQDSP